MKGDIRCVEGRSYRHDPQHDDPDLETDMGKCRECSGKGCAEVEAEALKIEAAQHGIKISTDFVYPPIPIRSMDWSAVDDNTYDGEGCKIGRGATEADAIRDLLELMEIAS